MIVVAEDGGTTGWFQDLYGGHEARYYSAGRPTAWVWDRDVEPFEEPVVASPSMLVSAGANTPSVATSQTRMPEVPDPQPQPPGSPWTLYWSDLRWCLRAMRAAPALVGISFAYWIVEDISAHLVPRALVGLVILVISLFWAGFVGTQRVWFLRLYRGTRLNGSRIMSFTALFIGRFIVLGLLVLLPLIVAVAVAIPFTLSHSPVHGTSRHLTELLLPMILIMLVLDVLLTFVVPALALSTSSVPQALRLGLRMIRITWPSCAWYVIAPGLTLTALAGLFPTSKVGWWAPVIVGAVSTFLGLWFKGATVAFYARAFPATPDTGSLFT
ncbi:MAG TPA: hypothetical protein VMU09_02590 [Acidimicrobiales bacterium]|nr:hypothetical protein [Acidimicrobiales bacterium]